MGHESIEIAYEIYNLNIIFFFDELLYYFDHLVLLYLFLYKFKELISFEE